MGDGAIAKCHKAAFPMRPSHWMVWALACERHICCHACIAVFTSTLKYGHQVRYT